MPQNVNKETLWYLDNYILLKDYYDRTVSRIAARCIRKGNIAMEEYPFYGYILDVLEEISETGDYVVEHRELYPYVEKKIPGGVNALKKNLNDFKTELRNNASPDMVKQDQGELDKMKEALGMIDKSKDPTIGAGMSMDEVMEKLLNKSGQPTQPQKNQAQPMSPGAQGQRPNPQNQRPQGQPNPQPRPNPGNPGQQQPRPQAPMKNSVTE